MSLTSIAAILAIKYYNNILGDAPGEEGAHAEEFNDL